MLLPQLSQGEVLLPKAAFRRARQKYCCQRSCNSAMRYGPSVFHTRRHIPVLGRLRWLSRESLPCQTTVRRVD